MGKYGLVLKNETKPQVQRVRIPLVEAQKKEQNCVSELCFFYRVCYLILEKVRLEECRLALRQVIDKTHILNTLAMNLELAGVDGAGG